MRIAISGSHATGKSTLARTLGDLLPTYAIVDEPYHFMISEGMLFSDPPVFEDFESQLERSISLLAANPAPDVIFERCPIDFFAYLSAFRNRDPEVAAQWFDLIEESIRTIDIIAYVPLESPDRIDVSSDEHPKLRRVVDRILRSFLVDDDLGLGLNVIELRGSVHERTSRLLEWLEWPAP
jgi:hypothetical protein